MAKTTRLPTSTGKPSERNPVAYRQVYATMDRLSRVQALCSDFLGEPEKGTGAGRGLSEGMAKPVDSQSVTGHDFGGRLREPDFRRVHLLNLYGVFF